MNDLDGAIDELLERESGRNFRADPGLTAEELGQAEEAFSIRFPPDLRHMLSRVLLTGPGFPNWRNPDDRDRIANQLAWPLEGLEFDVEHADLWLEGWGPRPADLPRALDRLREVVAAAPNLVPIYGHRYMAQAPPQPGTPVLSVYQADIIRYERDLAQYLHAEFMGSELRPPTANPAEPRIPFWGEILDHNSR